VRSNFASLCVSFRLSVFAACSSFPIDEFVGHLPRWMQTFTIPYLTGVVQISFVYAQKAQLFDLALHRYYTLS
jgi:hypothetical protein